MKKRDKAIAVAKPYFEGESKHEELFVTSDGQVFTEESFSDAHRSRLPEKEAIKVTRTEALAEAELGKKTKSNKKDKGTDQPSVLNSNLKELPKSLEVIADVEVLEALKVEENAKGEDARKGAIEAIDARIDAIKKAEDEGKGEGA